MPIARPIVAGPPTQEALRAYWVQLEARQHNVDPELALSVSRAENWSGDSVAHGAHGELGIMQILPSNWGRFRHCGAHLKTMQTNACYGVHILAACLRANGGNRVRALGCYNGHRDRAEAWTYLDAVERARLRVN